MIVIYITLHKGTDAYKLYAGFYSKAFLFNINISCQISYT